MAHATDSEETIKLIQILAGCIHSFCDVAVVPHRVLTSDDGISHSVSGYNFPTTITERRQISLEAGNVAVLGIETVGISVVEGVKRCGVQRGIVVDRVAIPPLKRLAIGKVSLSNLTYRGRTLEISVEICERGRGGCG